MQKKKPINLRVALFIAISLCFGICCALLIKLNENLLAIITASIFAVFVLLFLVVFFERGKNLMHLIFALAFIGIFILGYYSLSVRYDDYVSTSLANHSYTVSGKVKETGETDYGKSLVVSNATVDGIVSGKLKYKIKVYVLGDSNIDVGDVITFTANLKDINHMFEERFSPYDMASGIRYTASVTAKDVVVSEKRPNVFEFCNIFIRNSLEKGLDRKEFTVAYAMLTGSSELMDENVLTSYRYLGVAHIFAVSGLHIGFLATAFSLLFRKLKFNRYLKASAITAILIFYSGVCGFTPSSVRATVMSAVMLFLSAKGERYDGLSAVAVASIIVLLISPLQLFCVGFQLSFAVVIGILLLAKPIELWLIKKLKFLPRKICSSIGVVLSAQVAGMPISLMNFGYFSPISIIANFLLIPVIAVIFVTLLCLAIIGGLIGAQRVFLFLPNYALKFINILLTALDSEKLLITGIVIGSFVLFYYLAVLLISGFFNFKFKTKIISTAIAVVFFVSGTIFSTVEKNKYTEVYVCGSDSVCATVVHSYEQTTLIVSQVDKVFSLGNLRRLGSRKGIFDVDNVVILGGFDYDVQVFISRLRQVFNLDKVVYYGEQDVETELVMIRSFSEISLENRLDGEALPLGDLTAVYTSNGQAIDLMVKEKRIVVLATTDQSPNYDHVGENMDVLIVGDAVQTAVHKLKPKMTVTYRKHVGFSDGETNGNFLLSFK